MAQVSITRGRTKTLEVELSYGVEGEVLTSEIRETRNPASPLIASWSIAFANGTGSDGKLVLTLDDAITSAITHSSGFMDIKRVTDSGEPLDVFDSPLQVVFVNKPTA